MLRTSSTSIVLGFFGISHLGDAIMTTGLPRKIFQRLGKMVYVVHHPSTVGVFAYNPYVAAFKNDGYVTLTDKMTGPGHIIQKVERGLGLPVDPVPKGELYFSDEELRWAWDQRRQWRRKKPACILATGAFTDSSAERFSGLAWDRMARVLRRSFTLVQLMLTSVAHYKSETVLTDGLLGAWDPDTPVDGAIHYTNLPLRQYMSLFAVADCHVGPTSAGAHIAAALGMPALIVLNRIANPNQVVFPHPRAGMWMESFLYPQHTFVRSDGLYPRTFNARAFSRVVRRWMQNGSSQGQNPQAWSTCC